MRQGRGTSQLGRALVLGVLLGTPATAQVLGQGPDAAGPEAPSLEASAEEPEGVQAWSLHLRPLRRIAAAPELPVVPEVLEEAPVVRGEGPLEVQLAIGPELLEAIPEGLRVKFRPACAPATTVRLKKAEVSPHLVFYRGRVEAKALLGAGPARPTRGYAVFSTTENGDAQAFDRTLQTLAGSGGLPSERINFETTEDTGGFGLMPGDAEPTRCPAASTLAAGGSVEVPYQVVEHAALQGQVRFRRAASWIYYSGHYQCGMGGDLEGTTIHPSSFGTDWEGVEVVLFASCYAVDLAWRADQVKHPGAGLDARAWWKRFGGTLLGYRGSAPSGAAPAITRRFLAAAANLGDPDADPEGYSAGLARAWMAANGRSSATYATAMDRRGSYYRFQGARLQVVPRSEWEPGNDQIAFLDGPIKEFEAALVEEWMGNIDGRPPALEELLASRAYQDLEGRALEYFQRSQPDAASARRALRESLDDWLAYRHHIFYETNLRIWPSQAIPILERRLGRPPSLEELRAYYVPPPALARQLQVRPPPSDEELRWPLESHSEGDETSAEVQPRIEAQPQAIP